MTETQCIDDVSTAPLSPRLFTTPPSTPRRCPCQFPSTPPAAKANPMPALMRALWANSVTLAEQAIQAESDIARLPFWDHGNEPPLCFAVRHFCKGDIIELLLQHGADLDAMDSQGRCPADVLISTRTHMFDPTSYEDLDVVEKLLDVTPLDSTHWQASADAREDPPWLTFEDGGSQMCSASRGGA
jgi:hypothetical protein